MKVLIKNIGKIKEAEIDLNNQLTVFFGPNNTGKTYISYCLYGLGKGQPFGNSIKSISNYINNSFDDLFSNGNIQINLKEAFSNKREYLRSKFIESFREFLPQLFGNYTSDFSQSIVVPSLFENQVEFDEYLDKLSFGNATSVFGQNNNSVRYTSKPGGVVEIQINPNAVFNLENRPNVVDSIKLILTQFTFSFNLNSKFFIPAERIGIASFGKELVLNRFSKTNFPTKNNEFISYSLVINDAIQQQFQIANLQNRQGSEKFITLANEIENEILSGKLIINETGDVFYDYGNNDRTNISILNTASTIKSLSSLVFYLRYYAYRGQTLFIDEPEANLHPDNQRKIARKLVKLSNLGINVFISTHSDYIIREINIMIMLSKQSAQIDDLIEKFKISKEEKISSSKVGVYFFNNNKAAKINVSDTGFDATTIDETILDQNQALNEIRWTLFED